MWPDVEAVALERNGAGQTADDVEPFEYAYGRPLTGGLIGGGKT